MPSFSLRSSSLPRTGKKHLHSIIEHLLTLFSYSAFELDLMSSNPGKGVYKVALSVSSDDSRLTGNTNSVVEVKVLTKITVEDVEVGVADADQSTAPKLKKVAFPNKLDGAVEADVHQKLIMKFLLRDSLSNEAVKVHQAFVRLTHAETQQEIFFVAEQDSSSTYKFDLDLSSKAKDFQHLSGRYLLDLIVGDAVIENPTVWTVTDLKLTFTAPATAKKAASSDMYKPKPEIIVSSFTNESSLTCNEVMPFQFLAHVPSAREASSFSRLKLLHSPGHCSLCFVLDSGKLCCNQLQTFS